MKNEKVSTICSFNCAFSCYKENCPRGSWHKPAFSASTLPQTGSDKECPLMQFEAIPLSDRENIGYDDTWDICASCKYADVNGDAVSIARAYMKHCLDCPVNEIREAISEAESEAGCS